MDVRIETATRRARLLQVRGRGGRAGSDAGRLPSIMASTAGERDGRWDYWLRHCEGFQVSGPDGRIGSVALVLSSGGRIDGLVIRTGLLRARTMFVPVDSVVSVTPRRCRVELGTVPDSVRAPISHVVREAVTFGAAHGSTIRPLDLGGPERK